jgi:hypothetical protein
MKKHIDKIVIIGIISFILLQFGNGSTNAQNTNDLITLASVIQGEEIEVNEWSIHAREKITSDKDIENVVIALKKQFPEWKWTHTSDQQHWATTAISTEPSLFKEKITIVSTPTKQLNQAYIIYEVQGKTWTDQTERFLKQEMTKRISDIFRGNPTIFSCITAELDGKMESTLSSSINGMLKAFKADEIESIRENSFISVSATSPLFAESLETHHDNMNLQLAVRTQGLGSKTTLVVGTPIITIEY